MRKRAVGLLLITALLASASGCAGPAAATDGGHLHVVAATYPVYVLACAVAAGAENVEISRLSTGQVSCLHDYTLTVADARRLEQADLLLLNGAGLEGFLEDTLAQVSAPVVDCSAAVALLEADGAEHRHDGGEHEHDPHFWMDPRDASAMAEEIAQGLAQADPAQAQRYRSNERQVSRALLDAWEDWADTLEGLSCPYLITFHDGFRYFARAFGLELLFAMEEEDGATASARDIRTASDCVKRYGVPSVFMETNGSGSAAGAVAGETGAKVRTLSMLMDGPDAPERAGAGEILAALYLTPMGQNVQTLAEVLQ